MYGLVFHRNAETSDLCNTQTSLGPALQLRWADFILSGLSAGHYDASLLCRVPLKKERLPVPGRHEFSQRAICRAKYIAALPSTKAIAP